MLPVIGFNAKLKNNNSDELYFSVQNNYKIIDVTAIPYFIWANRGENDMLVWMHKYN